MDNQPDLATCDECGGLAVFEAGAWRHARISDALFCNIARAARAEIDAETGGDGSAA